MQFDAGQARTGGDVAEYMQSEWLRNQHLSDLKTVDSGAGPAAIGFGRVGLNGKPLPAMFAAVRGTGNEIWRFVFVDQRGLSDSDIDASRRPFAVWRLVARRSVGAAAPTHRGQPVKPGDTVDSLAAQMQVEKLPRDTLIVLNNLEKVPPKPGEKVKLIRRENSSPPSA